MHRVIKVVRAITRLNVGGPSHHVVLLTAGLNGGKFESELVIGMPEKNEGDMSFLAEDYGIPVRKIESLRNGSGILENLNAFWQLYRILKKERPDIAHLHLLKARFFGGLAARLAGVPIVIETFHGNLFSEYYGKLKTAAILSVEMLLGWLVMDRVIAISASQRQELVKKRICPARKVKVVQLGIGLDRFHQCPSLKGCFRREMGLSEQTILVGTVGRLVPVKGITYLLEAIAKISSAANLCFCLVIIGDGPLRSDLEKKVSELSIGTKVRFLGWRFDLEKIYADLDIVVLSSLNEGTPVSLIEAMAACRPVVATRVGGVPDVVEDGVTGLLVPSKNSEALAVAILQLLKDAGLRRRLGEQAGCAVYPKWDVSRLIQDMNDFYVELVESHQSDGLFQKAK